MSTRKRKHNVEGRRSSINKGIQKPIVDVSVDDGQNTDFSDLLNKKWKAFRVSPLYNFNAGRLKRYEKKVTQELNARRKFNSTVTYTCTFVLNEKLRLNQDCQEAVRVEVKSNEAKIIYLGYFTSWVEQKQESPGFTILPILLVHSQGFEISNVHMSLCKIFDCDIQPVTFSFFAIITFFTNLLQNPRKSTDISQEVLSLDYKIPCCGPKDKLTVTLFLQDTIIVLATIIDTVREKYSKVKNSELVMEFYNRILSHIYNVYNMELTLAELNKIVFPDAFITTDGQIKLSTDEVATVVLQLMQKFVALDHFSDAPN
ncbi:hypothetical protein RUM44_011698 [Polyplax serrata]|uniref:Centromere protein L n=1 Tax=Polyplax serrata TaxID=468196 RepID=A0ABR1AQU2_POLSC